MASRLFIPWENSCLIAEHFLLSAPLWPDRDPSAGVLWAMADEKGKVTREMIDSAAAIADVHIADDTGHDAGGPQQL